MKYLKIFMQVRFSEITKACPLRGVLFALLMTGYVLLAASTAGAREETVTDEENATREILIILRDQGQITEERYQELIEGLEEEEFDGVKLIPYWDKGLGMISEEGNFEMGIGGRIMVDFATSSADDEIEAAIPDFEGTGTEFRRARLFVEGTVYESIIFKAQYDFAGDDPAGFKDVYLGLKGFPVGTIRVGHFKEPFSIEEQTSSKYITFMERALPIEAFSPGRNTGIIISDSMLDDRMSWALGGFLNTDDFGDGFNDYSDHSVTARITGAPIYTDDGAMAMHLGGSYTHQFWSEDQTAIDYGSRPEAHLTDALAETVEFSIDDADIGSLEAAAVLGPLSMQGEYIQAMTTSDEAGDPDLSGYYIFGSFFLTGEHRSYKPGSGSFGRVSPANNFSLTEGGTGAWELTLRYSSLDLNDEELEGGKLSDITAGINWYLNPNTRVMFNYVYADLEDRVVEGAEVEGNADVYQMRFQIDF